MTPSPDPTPSPTPEEVAQQAEIERLREQRRNLSMDRSALEAKVAELQRTITAQASTLRMGRVKELEERVAELTAERDHWVLSARAANARCQELIEALEKIANPLWTFDPGTNRSRKVLIDHEDIARAALAALDPTTGGGKR